jgi:thymidylate synthase (FAD)
MNSVKLITVTPKAEETMGYVARVSNPKNQENPDVAGLLKYCIKHNHWSVFEQAHMTLEIETTRGIAAQVLRHRSFTFQEFSQRYANTNLLGAIPVPDLRRQDKKNRQNSIDDIPEKRHSYRKRSLPISLRELTYTMNSYVRVLRRNVRDLFSR